MSKFAKNRDLQQVKEGDLQKRLTKLLTDHEVLFYKTHGGLVYVKTSANTFAPRSLKSSWSDLIVLSEQGAIFVELKTETGRLKQNQIDFLNKVKELGFMTVVFRPRHFNCFYDTLQNCGDVFESLVKTLEKFPDYR